jgi:hypothetical protein
MVVHICNPSYAGGRDERIMVESSLGKNVSETISSQLEGGHGGSYL